MTKHNTSEREDGTLPIPKDGKQYITDCEELINKRIDQQVSACVKPLIDGQQRMIDKMDEFGKHIQCIPNMKAWLIFLTVATVIMAGTLVGRIITT
jgi:hypothetical protein